MLITVLHCIKKCPGKDEDSRWIGGTYNSLIFNTHFFFFFLKTGGQNRKFDMQEIVQKNLLYRLQKSYYEASESTIDGFLSSPRKRRLTEILVEKAEVGY